MSLFVFIISLILIVHHIYLISTYQEQFLSGWVLTSLILILTSYGIRKKIRMLPIGNAATWLKVHIYLGNISILIFCLHISWRIPQGWMEVLLATFFSLVALSGLVGLYLNQRLSKLLTNRGEEVIFERIPGFIIQLRKEAENQVLQCTSVTGSSTVSSFYTTELISFFNTPKNLIGHLVGAGYELTKIRKQMKNIDRYLNDQERAFVNRLSELTEKKDELDHQYSLQAFLKGWLFVHVPFTGGLIILVILHAVLTHAFAGSA